jgi:Flp pilus assembly protein CpaB
VRPTRPAPEPAIPGRPPRWQRRVLRHRRPLAALLTALLAWALLSVLRPAPPPTVEVLAAARDLAAGTVLVTGDLVARRVPEAARPADAPASAEELVGRTVVVPLLAGDAVLGRHLLTSDLLAGFGDDVVAVPVRLSDDAAAAVLRRGDVVDVLAATAGDPVDPASGSAVVVASRVRVLLAGGQDASAGSGLLGAAAPTTGSAPVVLAATSSQALALARAAVSARLTVAVRGG